MQEPVNEETLLIGQLMWFGHHGKGISERKLAAASFVFVYSLYIYISQLLSHFLVDFHGTISTVTHFLIWLCESSTIQGPM